MGRTRTTSEQGWRTYTSPSPVSPAQPEHRPQRLQTVELGDGSVVRRLPHLPVQLFDPPRSQTLSASSAISSTPSSRAPSIDDPFRPSSSGAVPGGGLFAPSYSLTSSAPIAFADSHPLSLSPSDATRRHSSSDDDDDAPEPSFGPSHQLPFEDDEDFEARSPLQPTGFPSSTSGSPSSPNRRRSNLQPPSTSQPRNKRSPFLTPLSISPSRRLSPRLNRSAGAGDTSHDSLGGGWRAISPARSPGGAEEGVSPSRGASLGRRGTLSAVAGQLRRMSVRVVNVTGLDDEDEADAEVPPRAETSALERSPGLGRGRRRSSAMTLAERRASRAGPALPEAMKIPEEDGDESPEQGKDSEVEEEEVEPEKQWERVLEKKERAYRQLRGKTLGVFGPDNAVRQAAARVLTLPCVSPLPSHTSSLTLFFCRWTEPLILVLIVLQVVVLTIQSAPNVYEHPRPTKGYFHAWEDYVLFSIFVFFTLEIAARILVTGLVFNPPLPASDVPLPKVHLYGNDTPSRTPSIIGRIQSRLSPQPSSLHSPLQSPLRSPSGSTRFPFPPSPSPIRGLSRGRRTSSDGRLSPVPLSPVKDPGTYPPATSRPSTDITAHGYSRYDYADNNHGGTSSISLVPHAAPSTPFGPRSGGVGVGIGLGLVAPTASSTSRDGACSIRSGLAATVPAAAVPASGLSTSASVGSLASLAGGRGGSTPYALAMRRQRAAYQHAFLRHSWNRIDAVAVIAYWISFGLAVMGWESEENLWFFRALSVMRATRLLAVTSGTQTILHSLKKASPLLVDVGLFVAFAMILFACVSSSLESSCTAC